MTQTGVQGHPTEALGCYASPPAWSGPTGSRGPLHAPLPSDITASLRADAAEDWRDDDEAIEQLTRVDFTDGTDL